MATAPDPAAPVSEAAVGFDVIVNACVTFSVTGMLTGTPAPIPVCGVMVIVPWYVPVVESTLGLTLTVKVVGVTPDCGDTLSQFPVDVALTKKYCGVKKSVLVTDSV